MLNYKKPINIIIEIIISIKFGYKLNLIYRFIKIILSNKQSRLNEICYKIMTIKKILIKNPNNFNIFYCLRQV